MTPAELTAALDLIAHAIEGGATPAQRAQAADHLTHVRWLLRDVKSGPDDVLIGRQAPPFPVRHPVLLLKLQRAAPPGALEWLLQWSDGLAGHRGRSTKDVTLVGHDDAWTQILEPLPPRVIGRLRRTTQGGGVDNQPP